MATVNMIILNHKKEKMILKRKDTILFINKTHNSDFMQRLLNFLSSTLGSINTGFEKASGAIVVDVEVFPSRIGNLDSKVKIAIAALNGGIWPHREGVMFAGNMDHIVEELKEIEEEQAVKNAEIVKKRTERIRLIRKIIGFIVFRV